MLYEAAISDFGSKMESGHFAEIVMTMDGSYISSLMSTSEVLQRPAG